MKNKTKALEAIEIIVGDDFCNDLEFDIYAERIKDERLKQAAKKLTLIYTIAHAEISKCSHPNWVNKKYEIINQEKNHEKQS